MAKNVVEGIKDNKKYYAKYDAFTLILNFGMLVVLAVLMVMKAEPDNANWNQYLYMYIFVLVAYTVIIIWNLRSIHFIFREKEFEIKFHLKTIKIEYAKIKSNEKFEGVDFPNYGTSKQKIRITTGRSDAEKWSVAPIKYEEIYQELKRRASKAARSEKVNG